MNQSPFLLSSVQACLSLILCLNSKLPRVLHHEGEVVVAVDRAADTLIVVAEFFEGHDAVGLLAVPLDHEVLEHLIWGLLSLKHIRVLACVVDLSDVFQSHTAVFGNIQLVVSSSDPHFACVVELSLK